MRLGIIPNPVHVLPSDGVTEVLIKAAAAHPIIALLLVAIIICFAWGATCLTIVKVRQLAALKHPEASRAIVELKKIDKARKRVTANKKGTG